jgi:signal transduction histidine kinase
MEHIESAMKGQRWEVVEIPIQHKDGLISNVLWNSATLYTPDGKTPIATIAQGQDITDRKVMEEDLRRRTAELEAANKELETFSYSVSHDLRAPLRTLDGFSEIVLMDYGDKLDETGKDYLTRVRKASQTMSQLIDDILKLSRINRAEMHREIFDLSALAESILDELKFSQPERKVELAIDPGILIKGDKDLLSIGLRNLLENAWKFTGKCPVARIELGAILQSNQKVYFIRDNGVGFDIRRSDKLFQPFQRLHDTKEFPGTGIGLATVQRVIRRHGGHIWAESEIGKGTTFYFTLG